MKIKTGDNVRVRAGKDKGKEGKVLQTFPKLNRIVVEGINTAVRHLRRARGTKGQKISFPSPIHVSNVLLISPKSGAAGRVGRKRIEKDGKSRSIRVLKVKGSTEDIE